MHRRRVRILSARERNGEARPRFLKGQGEVLDDSAKVVAEDPPTLGVPALPGWIRGARVLLVHDWLVAWAGAERVLEQICVLFPDADLVVGVRRKGLCNNEVTKRARETWLGWVPGARRHHRWFLPLEALAFMSLDTRPYDLVISSSHAFAKAVRTRRGSTLHVCYCYTPPRYLWDLYESHRRYSTLPQKLALSAGRSLLRRTDVWAATGVDHFVTLSHYVAERVRRCYGRHADVVYPPVQPKPGGLAEGPRQDFALYLGRLVPYKRVDLAIEACRGAGLPLVIAGEGPEREKLERLARGSARFLGSVDESEAGELLSTCRLFIFCGEEDFGIAPLEANAHGAPVVYYGRGGLAETMIPGVTGEMFREQTVEEIVAALRRAVARPWDEAALRQHASRYSPERFREAFVNILWKLARERHDRR